jgi:carbamoyltransferase
MNILGISGSTHDSSASLILNNEVFMAIEEERLTRKKHSIGQKPLNAIKALLRNAGISVKDIDLVSYFIDPHLYSAQAPFHVLFRDPQKYLFHPKQYRIKQFLNRGKRYITELDNLLSEAGLTAPKEYVQHHLAHAAGAFYLSGFDEAMVLVVDNMGELDSTTLLYGKGKKLNILKTQKIPHSLGMFYAAMTAYLGFKPWDEEGKVMALAAYGNPIISLEKMVTLTNKGFRIKKAFQMIQTRNYERCYDLGLVKMFGSARRPEERITQLHKDIAASLQYATEEVCKHLVSIMHEFTASRKLCVSGGVALNCKMNGELFKLPIVDEIYVPSAPGDSGSSLGAAVYSLVKHTNKIPKPIRIAGLGQGFTDEQIFNAISNSGMHFSRINDPAKIAAELLKKEGVIAWFQGRAEFGPRALGHRSILALPQNKEIRDFINTMVKHREQWRPLCPSIAEKSVKEYLENSTDGRFMNVAFEATSYARQRIPAVIHTDNTSRAHAVNSIESKQYARLLDIIGETTGDPVLLNTSFNNKGEPIVDSPTDAISAFRIMPINSLLIGNYVVRKNSPKKE